MIWEFGDHTEPAWVHVSKKESGSNRREILVAKKIKGKTAYVPFV